MQAQTFTVLHNFTGTEGSSPVAGLTMDRAGNLYGTAYLGGQGYSYCNLGCGSVFKMTRNGSGWTFTPIYLFSGPDGGNPRARVVFGPDGALYGTSIYGGYGHGIVFQLRPPATFCHAVLCPWHETILYSFLPGHDGAYPGSGDLVFDTAGNIYGTTTDGGANYGGTVFALTKVNGVWTETILHSFGGNGDGWLPNSGVILGSDGNLYGTTEYGGSAGAGTVYELAHSGSGWTETILHSFNGTSDGSAPLGGLMQDSVGNFYGTTAGAGSGFAGTLYELTPSGGGWNFQVLQNFSGYIGSYASVTMGSDGALYGTLNFGDVDVFKMTYSGGQWTQTGMNGQTGDMPEGNVVVGFNGHLYTTGSQGGTNNAGVVLEITP